MKFARLLLPRVAQAITYKAVTVRSLICKPSSVTGFALRSRPFNGASSRGLFFPFLATRPPHKLHSCVLRLLSRMRRDIAGPLHISSMNSPCLLMKRAVTCAHSLLTDPFPSSPDLQAAGEYFDMCHAGDRASFR